MIVEIGKGVIKRPTLLREIAELSIPVVFTNAGEDIRPNWPTEQLAALMPNGNYVEIPDAAHQIWLTHADELRNAVELVAEYGWPTSVIVL